MTNQDEAEKRLERPEQASEDAEDAFDDLQSNPDHQQDEQYLQQGVDVEFGAVHGRAYPSDCQTACGPRRQLRLRMRPFPTPSRTRKVLVHDLR